MKITALLASTSTLFASSLLLSSLLVSGACAQSRPSTEVPPPPAMNDPGVKPNPSADQQQTPPATAKHPLQMAPLALPSMKDGDPRMGRPTAAAPDVSIHQEGNNSVQEYSRNGQVYMVVVTPKNGIPQTYRVDPQGRLVDEHGKRPINPVMYKVLEWGKAPPPEDKSSGDSGN